MRLVEVEHFHRLFHVRLENVQRTADELAQRHAAVGDVDPDKAAVRDLAIHLAQRCVGLAKALLIALLLTRDVDAVAARVERPLMKDAGHPLGVTRRIVEDGVAAMRTDVVESAHLLVVAANDNQRNAGRMSE